MPKKNRPREADVKDSIKDILDEWGVFYWMPGMGAYGRAGVSDFVCIVEGMALVIEAKRDAEEKPTPLQKQFMNGVMEKGKGVALVIHADNLELLPTTLRRMTRGEKF
jgi:hypothetical protein